MMSLAICWEIRHEWGVQEHNDILKGVSRSFFLSMRFLPKGMREPVSLGYLLARASDTLADTEEIDHQVRIEALALYEECLSDTSKRDSLQEVLLKEFTPKQKHEKEKQLLENLPEIFEWFDDAGDWQREAIYKVLGHIIKGQSLDLQRFGVERWTALKDEEMLDEYTYLVAGCVGEFWTEVGFGVDPEFSSMDKDKLMQLGVNHGKGLQLINIIRDLPNDAKAGRCYIPVENPEDRGELLMAAAHARAQAREYLDDGIEYAKSLRQRRTRMASALPAFIGEKTLDLLDDADFDTWAAGVKIKRSRVYNCLVKALLI